MNDDAITRVDAAMARYARGDRSAFAEIHAATAHRLHCFFRRLGSPGDETGDHIQETYVRLHKIRETYRPEHHALPWISAIAHSVFIDRHRAQAGRDRHLHRFAALSVTQSSINQPESAAIAGQLGRRFEAALRALPERSRRAFLLVRVQGKTLDETARALGTTKGAAKLRVFRAVESLRHAIEF